MCGQEGSEDRVTERNRNVRRTEEWVRSEDSVEDVSKSLQTINAGEGVEKREPSYTVGGNAN